MTYKSSSKHPLTQSLTKLRSVWKEKNISQGYNIIYSLDDLQIRIIFKVCFIQLAYT